MEDLDSELAHAVHNAVLSLNAETGDLDPSYRTRIYSAFGHDDDPRANRGRGMLAVLTARYVLPIYESGAKNDTASMLIEMAESVLEERESSETALLFLYGIQAGDWLNPRHKGYPASCAGSASVSALQEACGWNGLVEGERDCAYHAARAFSARLVPETGRHERDPKKLREFWQWWLTEAIPTAWAASADRAR